VFDCAIIGGGPAGLNAALILGRAKRNVILFDNNKARNAVTQESHGFITRDGIKPKEFREIAHNEIGKYPSVKYVKEEVTSVIKVENFELVTSENELYQSKAIIISTGLKDLLPSIENISDYYGKSLFHCPYCDGWELRDKPLVVIIGEQVQGFHFIQTIYNWSKDLIVCTNGNAFQNSEQKNLLLNKGIKIIENRIKNFVGKNGRMSYYHYLSFFSNSLFTRGVNNPLNHDFKDKHLRIKKATGLGITEFFLRVMAWLCTSSREFPRMQSQMCIVTGPNEYSKR